MLYEGDFFRSLFAELGDATAEYLEGRRLSANSSNGSSELMAVITQQGGKRTDGELSAEQFHQQIRSEAQDLARWLNIQTIFTTDTSPFEFVLSIAGSRHTCDEITALDGTILPAQIIIWVFNKARPSYPVRMYDVAEKPSEVQKEFTWLSEQAYVSAINGLKKASNLSEKTFFENLYTYLVHGNQNDNDRLQFGGGRGAGSNTMMHSMVTVFTSETQKREKRVFAPDEVLKFASPLDTVFMRHTAQSLCRMLQDVLPIETYPFVRIHPSVRYGEEALVIEFDPPQTKECSDMITLKATHKLHELQQVAVTFFEKLNHNHTLHIRLRTEFAIALTHHFHFEPAQAQWLSEYVASLQPDILQLENWLANADLDAESRRFLTLRLKRSYIKAAKYAESNPQAGENRNALSTKIHHILGGGHLADITPVTYLMTDRLIPGYVMNRQERLKLLKNARAVYLPKEASFVISQKPILDPESGDLKICCVCLTNRHASHKGGAESIQNAPIERAQKL